MWNGVNLILPNAPRNIKWTETIRIRKREIKDVNDKTHAWLIVISILGIYSLTTLAPLLLGGLAVHPLLYPGVWILTLFSIASVVAVTLNRKVTSLDLLMALAVCAVVGGTSLLFLRDGNPATFLVTFFVNGVPAGICYLGGYALLSSTGLTHIRFIEKDWKRGVESIGLGVLFSIPWAILNILMIRGSGSIDVWMKGEIWRALAAIQPGVSEEIEFRLFLLTASFYLLSPYLTKSSAAWVSIFLSAFIHGYIHVAPILLSSSIQAMVYGFVLSIIFGLPMSYLYVKRDLETAISFHFFIDFVRFIYAYFVL